MRFTTITGKAKKYVEDHFTTFLDGKLNDNILYLERNNRIYHVPTIRNELVDYLIRYVKKNLEENDANKKMVRDVLLQMTWDDVFTATHARDLLFPIKVEPPSLTI